MRTLENEIKFHHANNNPAAILELFSQGSNRHVLTTLCCITPHNSLLDFLASWMRWMALEDDQISFNVLSIGSGTGLLEYLLQYVLNRKEILIQNDQNVESSSPSPSLSLAPPQSCIESSSSVSSSSSSKEELESHRQFVLRPPNPIFKVKGLDIYPTNIFLSTSLSEDDSSFFLSRGASDSDRVTPLILASHLLMFVYIRRPGILVDYMNMVEAQTCECPLGSSAATFNFGWASRSGCRCSRVKFVMILGPRSEDPIETGGSEVKDLMNRWGSLVYRSDAANVTCNLRSSNMPVGLCYANRTVGSVLQPWDLLQIWQKKH